MTKFQQLSAFPSQIGLSQIADLAEKIGAPFWAYNADIVRRQIASLRSFDTIRYAQKANSNISILKLMRGEGVKVDAVSHGELERALVAGFATGKDNDEIVYTADLVDEPVLSRLIDLGVTINCGSPDMVEQVGRKSPGHPIWLRINPGFGHGHNQKTNTGGPASKHGIWHERLAEALAHVDQYKLDLVGLHMHIGSGVDYQHLARVCDAMITEFERIDRPMRAISAGGGLSIPYRSEEARIDTEHYFSIWDAARRKLERRNGGRLRLEIEPGRFLVAGAGVLVCEVRAVKMVADRVFVLVNAGFSELVRPAMYGSYHRISFLTRNGHVVTGTPQPVILAGPLCEAGDVFTQGEGGVVEHRHLPVPKVGDLAILHDAGAYGASMSSNYNTRALAPEILIDGPVTTVIRERQAIAAILDLEKPRALSGLF